jgi:hypothetical protein
MKEISLTNETWENTEKPHLSSMRIGIRISFWSIDCQWHSFAGREGAWNAITILLRNGIRCGRRMGTVSTSPDQYRVEGSVVSIFGASTL